MNLKCEFTGNESYSLPELGDDWQYQYVNLTCDLSPPQGNSIQFDLQFDLTLSPHFDWAYDTPGLSWHVISAYDSSNMYTLDKTMNQTFTWPGDSDPLMVMAYAEIEFNDDYIHSDILSGIRVDKATECSLELCIFEYEVSVENGTPNMTTSVLDYGQLFWRNSSGPSKHTLCWKPTSSPPDIKIDDHTTNSEFLQLSPVEFAFCGVAYEIELDEKVFVGSCSQGHVRGPNITTNPDVTAYDNPFNGDPNALRIGSFGLDTIMSNLAKHMNKEALRLNGSDVHGTTFVTEVFVEVQWLWLILPIILVVSGTMFIAIVIIQNKTNGTTLWKSSVLAFLYHGLHEVNKDDSMTASVMEKKAEGLVVQLQESEDHGGLILQEKKDSM
jgi:hypothetical protein